MAYEQKRLWITCQRCGSTMQYRQALEDGWLVAPWRTDPKINVVRCFRHITYRSMRESFAGETNHWKQKMQEGRERAAKNPGYNPALEPYPTRDE